MGRTSSIGADGEVGSKSVYFLHQQRPSPLAHRPLLPTTVPSVVPWLRWIPCSVLSPPFPKQNPRPRELLFALETERDMHHIYVTLRTFVVRVFIYVLYVQSTRVYKRVQTCINVYSVNEVSVIKLRVVPSVRVPITREAVLFVCVLRNSKCCYRSLFNKPKIIMYPEKIVLRANKWVIIVSPSVRHPLCNHNSCMPSRSGKKKRHFSVIRTRTKLRHSKKVTS